MFTHSEVLRFFPTLIWSNQIEDAKCIPMNSIFRKKLEDLVSASPDPEYSGMWQTDHDLHTLPELEELNDYIMNATEKVIEFLELKQGAAEITGSWANISPSGISHRSHMHANNFLSGVYYVSVPRGGDRITFHDPRAQIHIVAPPVENINGYNSEYVNLEVREGMLILFPAWLVHSVPANSADEIRISIAFNINFSDFTKIVSPPVWEPNLPTRPDRD